MEFTSEIYFFKNNKLVSQGEKDIDLEGFIKEFRSLDWKVDAEIYPEIELVDIVKDKYLWISAEPMNDNDFRFLCGIGEYNSENLDEDPMILYNTDSDDLALMEEIIASFFSRNPEFMENLSYRFEVIEEEDV